MWVLGVTVEAAGTLFTTFRPPASIAYSLTHFLPLSQKGFAGAAALEVACVNGERRQGHCRPLSRSLPSPVGAQWAGIHVFCRIPLNPVPIHQPAMHISPSSPLAFISSQQAETRRRCELVLTNVHTTHADSHNTHGHTHLSQSMILCLALCSRAWPIFMRSRLFLSQDAESGL